MANAQMTYQIGTFSPITIGTTSGNGPTPVFTTVSVKSFVPDSGNKVLRDGTGTGLIVNGKGKYDIDFTVAAPANDPYTYSVLSAFFKLKSGPVPAGGLADAFPDQSLSVVSGVTWLTISDNNNTGAGTPPVFEFYLVVYRSDGAWGLIDPLITNKG